MDAGLGLNQQREELPIITLPLCAPENERNVTFVPSTRTAWRMHTNMSILQLQNISDDMFDDRIGLRCRAHCVRKKRPPSRARTPAAFAAKIQARLPNGRTPSKEKERAMGERFLGLTSK